MPPFAGNDRERGALAAYIVNGLRGDEIGGTAAVTGGSGEGRGLFQTHCTICHPESLVKARTRGWDYEKIRSALDNLNHLQKAMPDFTGPPEVKDRIAGYIYLLNSPGGTMEVEGENGRVKP
jgi:mono/diheme cytochrome c family protein